MITRRTFLLSSTVGVGAAVAFGPLSTSLAQMPPASGDVFEITRTEAEWQALLTPAQFAILRREGTEYSFTNTLLGETSDLLHEEREGIYSCAGCDLPVYSSEHKYDSRTGWPSYWIAIDDAVRTKEDPRIPPGQGVEVHCRRCGGHLGHIFVDGPPPTFRRHCINGLALTFEAA
jgi:peptide-methionine (R)-S-oxide reductase